MNHNQDGTAAGTSWENTQERMDYMNIFRNGGQQASYMMPQYGSSGHQTVQQQHGQQRLDLHHHHQQQQQQIQQQQQHNQYQLHHHQAQQHIQHQLPQQGQQTAQGYSFPYTNEQLLVLARMQHHKTMLQQAQGAIHAPPQTKQEQPKPRLSKDEVELLEKEFQKNQKPSSGRKREIADLLKVDQPRINNWFQNRRAKEKGIKKTQEFAARQAAENNEALEADSIRSPDTDAEGVGSDYFSLDSQQHSGRPSSAPFPDPRQETEPAETSSIADETSYAAPVDQSLRPSIEHGDCGGAKLEYPSPDSLPFQGNESADLDFTPHASNFMPSGQSQGEYQDGFVHDGLPIPDFVSPQPHDQLPYTHSHLQFTTATGPDSIHAPTPSFPSQLLGRLELHEIKEEDQQQPGFDLDGEQSSTHQGSMSDVSLREHTHQQSSPNSLPTSPPTINDLRFKSPPPPSNIASRRNKGVPAQLSATALRAYSYGPRTGLDMSKRSDAASPGMRRIASATGPTMPGRIQKSLAAGTIGGSSGAPRSPLFLERTKDALMRSLQSGATVRSPVMGSTNNATSPMTPAGEYFSGLSAAASASASAQGTREPTVVSSASDDEQRYGLGATPSVSAAGVPGGFFTGTLKTPPGTPGLNGTGFSDHQVSNQINTFEAAWNFNPHDEPLVTPGLGSFGSEEFAMASSAPSYVGSSQPPTPSFPHSIGPSSFGGYPWPTVAPSVASFSGAGVPAHPGSIAEYTFPDSFAPDVSARSSPGLPAKSSKQFQFTQNVTPQDFSDK